MPGKLSTTEPYLFNKIFLDFVGLMAEYWVGKQVIVHLGVFGLDVVIRASCVAPPQSLYF